MWMSSCRLPGAQPVHYQRVTMEQWRTLAVTVQQQGGRLMSLWGQEHASGAFSIEAALVVQEGVYWLSAMLESLHYPAIDDIFPNANRMQRVTADLLGISAQGARDQRPWWQHGQWGCRWPLRKTPLEAEGEGERDYPFVTVAGPGVHEIPVGPVHAGIIEPGHFRFSVVGERILRLDTHLGYTHKGLEKLAAGMDPESLVRLGGRVSGDSTVAGSWATAQALEAVLGLSVVPRAEWLRALWLECERVINHLGDLGALCNDVGWSYGFAQLMTLKEATLRIYQEVGGHRYLRDTICLGGVGRDVSRDALALLRGHVLSLEREVRHSEERLRDHAGVQDRWLTTGRVSPSMAAHYGMSGLAGRASAQAWDWRVNFPSLAYQCADVQMATATQGDVAARVAVRFAELHESLRLIGHFVEQMPQGNWKTDWNGEGRAGIGMGWVEGWRGEMMAAVELDERGRIVRWHPEEVSMSQWPVLEQAVLGNIVPDFPLINKSFNLSYSGQDG